MNVKINKQKERDSMIRRIACDLDGTLLNENHQLDIETIRWIQKLQEAGIAFMPATGRHYDSVKKVFRNCPLHHEMLLLNGGLMVDNDGQLMMSVPMQLNQIKAVMKLLQEHDFCYNVYTNEGTAVSDRERSLNDFRQHLLAHGESMDQVDTMILEGGFFENMKEIGNEIDSYLSSSPIVFKMETHGSNQTHVNELRQQLQTIPDLALTNSIGDNVEITHVDAQKGHTLMNFCNINHINPDDVLVIGDSMNDLSMIKQFKHSVAMANAIPEIKQHASYITIDTFKNHGVHEIFEKVLASSFPL